MKREKEEVVEEVKEVVETEDDGVTEETIANLSDNDGGEE